MTINISKLTDSTQLQVIATYQGASGWEGEGEMGRGRNQICVCIAQQPTKKKGR
jgi:hypothetical protein